MFTFWALWGSLSTLGASWQSWGTPHCVAIQPHPCSTELSGHRGTTPLLGRTPPPPASPPPSSGPPSPAKHSFLHPDFRIFDTKLRSQYSITSSKEKIFPIWVPGKSLILLFSNPCPGFPNMLEVSWARSMDLGGFVWKPVNSGFLSLATACQPNTWFLMSVPTWKISQ